MPPRSWFILLLCLVTASARAASATVAPDGAVRTELHQIFESDQVWRRQLDAAPIAHGSESKEVHELGDRIHRADAENWKRVKAILEEHGWLGPAAVGPEESSALFLVIQHADYDTQSHFLPMMRDAVQRSNARPQDLALLEDRIAQAEGRPQVYGRQLRFDDTTRQFVVGTLLDPDHVDERRAKVGLPPLADYLSHWHVKWDVADNKQQQAQAAAKQAKANGAQR